MAALMTLREHEQRDDIMVSWAYSGRDQLIFKDTVFPITKEFPVAVSFDQIRTVQELIKETKEQIRLGVAVHLYLTPGLPILCIPGRALSGRRTVRRP